ncbi:MAG TPA: hypothetical protein VJ461_05830 [Candidatus Nanoarchaeia archaeon]|nr:hypothetical protein [Candidatus Nanoarchaeia archaeon]
MKELFLLLVILLFITSCNPSLQGTIVTNNYSKPTNYSQNGIYVENESTDNSSDNITEQQEYYSSQRCLDDVVYWADDVMYRIEGTKYGECSRNKPLYCENGWLVNKASECGCPPLMVVVGENCEYNFKLNPKTIKLRVGEKDYMNFTVYGGLNEYLKQLRRPVLYEGYSEEEGRNFYNKFLDEEAQRPFLNELLSEIKKQTPNRDEQADIAINLVQYISYDYKKLLILENELTNEGNYSLDRKYPFQVLYEQRGLCEEKSLLLIYLLRELGYGTALLMFEEADHASVGVKCLSGRKYGDIVYCPIETTLVSDPNFRYYSDVYGSYYDAEAITISDGDVLIRN